jgi:phosphatidate cytidylyltransferase
MSTRQRLATGVPAAAAAIAVLGWGGPWGFAVLVAVFVVAVGREACRLLVPGHGALDGWLVVALSLACLPVVVLRDPFLWSALAIAIVLVPALWCLRVPGADSAVASIAPRWSAMVFAVVYAGVPVAFALALRGLAGGVVWVLAVLGCAFLGDTGAYFAGRAFGKTPFAPRISPKKTWAGVVGGYAIAVVAVVAFLLIARDDVAWWQAALFGLVVNTAGIAGDLAASAIKRAAGVKDSGVLLPGHGGAIDRVDSALFAVPVAYLMTHGWFGVAVVWP